MLIPTTPTDKSINQLGFINQQSEAETDFNEYYSGVVAERLYKWFLLIQLNGGNLPQRSDQVKRYVRKGIPQSLRARTWFFYSGARALYTENEGLYDILTFREEQDVHAKYTRRNNSIYEHIEIIDRDLLRTFPDNIHFKRRYPPSTTSSPPRSDDDADSQSTLNSDDEEPSFDLSIQSQYLQSLRRILVAFSYYSWPHPDPSRKPPRVCTYDIGYCQGMNFIVGLLLLVYAQEEGEAFSSDQEVTLEIERRVFWTLVVIVEELLPPETYGSTLEGAQLTQEVLWKYILGKKGSRFGVERTAKFIESLAQGKEPASSQNDKNSSTKGVQPIGNQMPPMEMITTQWFLTLFINVFPMETTLRIWDCFMYQGEKVLHRVILTLIKSHEEAIMSFNRNEPILAWKYVKELPKSIYNCHSFMEACFKPRYPILDLQPVAHLDNAPTDVDSEYEDDGYSPMGHITAHSGKFRLGVGPVPTKLIEKYRELAKLEREGAEIPLSTDKAQ